MIKELISKAMDFILLRDIFRNYINYRYDFNRQGMIPLNEGYFSKDGILFTFHDMLWNDMTAFHEYNMDDILPTDIVLDLGATGGGFTLQAARKAKHVFAVEPLYADLLKKNVKINNYENITVLEYALGNTSKGFLSYGYPLPSITKEVDFVSLKNIINMCGGHIDFLKCDSEGGEWSIKTEELKGIRRIEMEVHKFNEEHEFETFEQMLTEAGFEYTKEIRNSNTLLIHAKQQLKT